MMLTLVDVIHHLKNILNNKKLTAHEKYQSYCDFIAHHKHLYHIANLVKINHFPHNVITKYDYIDDLMDDLQTIFSNLPDNFVKSKNSESKIINMIKHLHHAQNLSTQYLHYTKSGNLKLGLTNQQYLFPIYQLTNNLEECLKLDNHDIYIRELRQAQEYCQQGKIKFAIKLFDKYLKHVFIPPEYVHIHTGKFIINHHKRYTTNAFNSTLKTDLNNIMKQASNKLYVYISALNAKDDPFMINSCGIYPYTVYSVFKLITQAMNKSMTDIQSFIVSHH